MKGRFKFSFFSIALLSITSAAANPYTISGISSGGFIAAQMGTIFSSSVKGVGIVSAGFYDCAGDHYQSKLSLAEKLGNGLRSFLEVRYSIEDQLKGDFQHLIQLDPRNPLYEALEVCMQSPSDSTIRIDAIKARSTSGEIDSLQNLSNQKILIYHGEKDSVVKPEMEKRTQEFYQQAGVPEENLLTILNPHGAHTFPTDKSNLESCETQGIPYVSSCDLDLAGTILKNLTGKADLTKSSPDQMTSIRRISQETLGRPNSVSKYGYVAAGDYCLENPNECDVHVALHGCEMSDSFDPEFDHKYQKYLPYGYLNMRSRSARSFWTRFLPVIDDAKPNMGAKFFAEKSGFLEYANNENKIIVLFPQTWITEDNYPGNPKGCWDWYGWTGSDYVTRTGKETSWLQAWIQEVRKNPKVFLTE